MARARKPDPIITHEAILAMAGQHIQSEILRLRGELNRIRGILEAAGRIDDLEHTTQMTESQVSYHMERLKAVESMYRIETGTDLGLIAELSPEEVEE